MSAQALTHAQIQDWNLVQKIESDMKIPTVSRSGVMKALGK